MEYSLEKSIYGSLDYPFSTYSDERKSPSDSWEEWNARRALSFTYLGISCLLETDAFVSLAIDRYLSWSNQMKLFSQIVAVEN